MASDTRSAGVKQEKCIPEISTFLEENGYVVARTAVCPDELLPLRDTIRDWAQDGTVDVILTSGGTGVSPRDVTPEATRPLLDKEIPGIPEAMRFASFQKTVNAVISRGLAGLIGGVLVINLPGSPKAAVENLAVIHAAMEHIVKKAKGDPSECAPPS